MAIDAGTDTPAAAPPTAASSNAESTVAPSPSQSAPSPAPPAEDNGNDNVNGISRDTVAKLALELGSQPNNNPNSTFPSIPTRLISEAWSTEFGDCDGPNLNGKIARVPCACPPLRDDFITVSRWPFEQGHRLTAFRCV